MKKVISICLVPLLAGAVWFSTRPNPVETVMGPRSSRIEADSRLLAFEVAAKTHEYREPAFNGPRFITVGTNGTVYVIDESQRALQAFDRTGRQRWRKAASVPHAHLIGMKFDHDTIYIMDIAKTGARVLRFDTTGAALEPHEIAYNAGIAVAFNRVAGRYAIVSRKYEPLDGDSAGGGPSTKKVIDELVTYPPASHPRPIGPWVTTIASEKASLFGNALEIDAAFSNIRHFAFAGDKLLVSDPNDYKISELSLADASGEEIDIAVARVPISTSMIDQYIRASIEDLEWEVSTGSTTKDLIPEWQGNILPILRKLRCCDHRPVIRNIWGSSDGSFAIERDDVYPLYKRTSDSTVIDIVDAAGKRQGHVMAPPHSKVLLYENSELYIMQADNPEGLKSRHQLLIYKIGR